jgi:hypothetical protein
VLYHGLLTTFDVASVNRRADNRPSIHADHLSYFLKTAVVAAAALILEERCCESLTRGNPRVLWIEPRSQPQGANA